MNRPRAHNRVVLSVTTVISSCFKTIQPESHSQQYLRTVLGNTHAGVLIVGGCNGCQANMLCLATSLATQ